MKKDFKLEDWQKIITNWLAQLENTSQFPTWKIVLEALNIHQKCATPLKNDLRSWYRSFATNQKFPPQSVDLPENLKILPKGSKCKIKTKQVFDVNKNLVEIVLPPNLKNHLSLKEAKQKILNSIKGQNINVAITNWTTISKKLSYNYNYSLESRQPVKEWYNEYRQKCIHEFEKKNQAENSFDLKNPQRESIKSTQVVIDNSNQTNLRNQLVLIFDQMKNQLVNNLISTDSKLTHYYEAFFQQFTPKRLFQNCKINHGLQGLEIINKFHNVSNLEGFKKYLDSIPGLYPKIILWAIRNPFPKISSSIQIKHHAMPKFLIKHYGFKEQEIQVDYNLVKISWSFHFVWHLVRFVEYNQIQDFVALDFMLQHPTVSEKKCALSNQNALSTNELSMNKLISSFLYNNFIPSMLTNSQFEKQLSTFLASNRMSDNTKQILTTTTKWRHKNDFFKKDGECFELIFNPQDTENCSIKNFSVEFINQLNTYPIQVSGKPLLFDNKNQDNTMESTIARLSLYFRGYTGSVSNFYIVNPPDFIKPIAVVGNNKYSENRRSQRDPKQKNILNEIEFTITHKNPKVPIINGRPGQFKSIYDITAKCCQLEYKYLNVGTSENITANERSNYRLSDYFKRILFLDNPTRKRKRRSTTGLTRNKPRMQYHHCRGWTAKKLR